jgi:hypothetical protein
MLQALLVIYNDKKICRFDNLTLTNAGNPLTALPVAGTFDKMIILALSSTHLPQSSRYLIKNFSGLRILTNGISYFF